MSDPVLMYDSAFPPSAEQAEAFAADGTAIWGCYLSSPGAYNAWHPEEVERLKNAGIEPLPIWVPGSVRGFEHGLGEGISAAGLVNQFYKECPAVCLDIEASMYDNERDNCLAYAKGFAQAVTSAGLRVVAYGPFRFLATIHASQFHAAWAASYIDAEPSGLPPFQLRGLFSATAWQWKGTHEVHGLGVDRSIADSSLVTGKQPPGENLLVLVESIAQTLFPGPTEDAQVHSALQAFVRLLFRGDLAREIDKPEAQEYGVSAIKSGGLDAYIAWLQDGPEGAAIIGAERKDLGL